MDWINLSNEEQLHEIKAKSMHTPQVIFKHSTRCSISHVAKDRLERNTVPAGMDFYYLDLIKFRGISNKVSKEFNVYHQSPQVLIIKNGESVYDESHTGIDLEEIAGMHWRKDFFKHHILHQLNWCKVLYTWPYYSHRPAQ